jgi:hypothetical protein
MNAKRPAMSPANKALMWWLRPLLSKFQTVYHLVNIPGYELPYKILIGTHHKTGTVWMQSIFRNICLNHSLVFFAGIQADLPENYDIFLEGHSKFDLDAVKVPFRGLHLIRDPRDVIISGCFYHAKASEAWLHRAQQDLQGFTYQESLNRCSTLDEKIMFEMEHAGKHAVDQMLQWNYHLPAFLELKYEDLLNNTDLTLFHRAFLFLGFPELALPSLLLIAQHNSLFSGHLGKSAHIRSGEARQWMKYFKRSHKKRFLELFGDALIRLGYEKDDGWAFGDERV